MSKLFSFLAFVTAGFLLCCIARDLLESAGLNPVALDVAIIVIALLLVRPRVRVRVKR